MHQIEKDLHRHLRVDDDLLPPRSRSGRPDHCRHIVDERVAEPVLWYLNVLDFARRPSFLRAPLAFLLPPPPIGLLRRVD